MATFRFDPNALPLLELGTEQFRYYAEHRLFAAETSTLYLPGKPATWWLQRLYADDPGPQGICLRSHRTGSVRRFVLVYSKERRGWVYAWVFDALEEPEDIHVVIYNDFLPVFDGVEVRCVR